MGELQSEIKYLKGVGPKRAELLQKELGIATIGDLIRLYPFRYIDRSSIQNIASVSQDVASIQIQARVVSRTLYGPAGSIVKTDIPREMQPDASWNTIYMDLISTTEHTSCRTLPCL